MTELRYELKNLYQRVTKRIVAISLLDKPEFKIKLLR